MARKFSRRGGSRRGRGSRRSGRLCRSSGVDFAAVVEDAVGDGNVGGREDDVVAECLVEYLAGEGDGRGFAFDEKAGGAVFAESHDVEAAGHAVEVDGTLDGNGGRSVAFVPDEVVDDVLAHPLFGGEDNVFFADDVEYQADAALFLDFVVEGRQGECFHGRSFSVCIGRVCGEGCCRHSSGSGSRG